MQKRTIKILLSMFMLLVFTNFSQLAKSTLSYYYVAVNSSDYKYSESTNITSIYPEDSSIKYEKEYAHNASSNWVNSKANNDELISNEQYFQNANYSIENITDYSCLTNESIQNSQSLNITDLEGSLGNQFHPESLQSQIVLNSSNYEVLESNFQNQYNTSFPFNTSSNQYIKIEIENVTNHYNSYKLINLVNASSISLDRTLTANSYFISFWIYFSNVTQNYLIYMHSSAGDIRSGFYFSLGSIKIIHNGSYPISVGNVLNNQWNHFLFEYNPIGICRYYVNSVLKYSASLNNPVTHGILKFRFNSNLTNVNLDSIYTGYSLTEAFSSYYNLTQSEFNFQILNSFDMENEIIDDFGFSGTYLLFTDILNQTILTCLFASYYDNTLEESEGFQTYLQIFDLTTEFEDSIFTTYLNQTSESRLLLDFSHDYELQNSTFRLEQIANNSDTYSEISTVLFDFRLIKHVYIKPFFSEYQIIHAISSNVNFRQYDVINSSYELPINYREDFDENAILQLYETTYEHSFYDSDFHFNLIGTYEPIFDHDSNEFYVENRFQKDFTEIDSLGNKAKVYCSQIIEPLFDMNTEYRFNTSENAFDSMFNDFSLTVICEFVENYSLIFHFSDEISVGIEFENNSGFYYSVIMHVYYRDFEYYDEFTIDLVNGINPFDNTIYVTLTVKESEQFSGIGIKYDKCYYFQQFTWLEITTIHEVVYLNILNYEIEGFFYHNPNSRTLAQFKIYGLRLTRANENIINNTVLFQTNYYKTIYDYYIMHSELFLLSYAHIFNISLEEPSLPVNLQSTYKIVNSKINNVSWICSSQPFDSSLIGKEFISSEQIATNQSYTQNIANNVSDLFNAYQSDNFDVYISITNGIITFYSNDSIIISRVLVEFTSTWILLIEEYKSLFDIGLNMIVPIVLIFIFPYAFYKAFGKFGFAIGLIFSIGIWTFTQYLNVLQSIVLFIVAFIILGIIIAKYRKEKEQNQNDV